MKVWRVRQREKRVVEARLVDAELAARDAVLVQRDDDGGRHVVGSGDENPLSCALDAVNVGKRCERVEVDGGRRDERHPLVGLHRGREICRGVEGLSLIHI